MLNGIFRVSPRFSITQKEDFGAHNLGVLVQLVFDIVAAQSLGYNFKCLGLDKLSIVSN